MPSTVVEGTVISATLVRNCDEIAWINDRRSLRYIIRRWSFEFRSRKFSYLYLLSQKYNSNWSIKKDITYCHDILIWLALEIIRKKASIVRNCYTIRIGSDEEEEAINSRRRGRTSYINLLFGTMTHDRDYARY